MQLSTSLSSVLPRATATQTLPRWWPARWYYGWALVGTLGLTIVVSYGILSYSLAAFILPMSHELGWSKVTITSGFSLAHLVAGCVSIPMGEWVDRRGARGLMTAGSVLAALLLVAWSRVETLSAYYVLWMLMGVAMAAVFYEPAFAVITTWFHLQRNRALTVLTFIGGFASIIFVPMATTLVAAIGWREALVVLAIAYALLTVLPHAVVLRRRPLDFGLGADGAPPFSQWPRLNTGTTRDGVASAAVRSPAFRLVAIAFALAAFVSTAMTVHLVPLLLERGFSPAFAGSAMGVLGLMALPGRLIFTPLGARWSRASITAVIFALQTVACVVLLVTPSAIGVWTFVLLFGAGFGAITPARASLVAELFDTTAFARISGVLALVLSLARAAAPVGASLMYAAGGTASGYAVVLCVAALLGVIAAVSLMVGSAQPVAAWTATAHVPAPGVTMNGPVSRWLTRPQPPARKTTPSCSNHGPQTTQAARRDCH